MQKRIIIVFALLVSALFFSAAAHALEFSADTVFTSEGHKMNGKMFAATDKFRMEMTSREQMIMISRMDKKVVWNIMPAQKKYMEMPFDPTKAPKTETKIKGEMDRKQVGSETIDGHPTKKYLVTYKNDNNTTQMYQWIATDINFPVKTADINNKWTQEYKNIKLGPQPDSIFELPAGYSKMQMPKMPSNMKAK